MNRKQEIVTFKVDTALAEKLRAMSNRSEFIREAVLRALGYACPLCQGTGIMTPEQYRHWDTFVTTHSVEKCDECNAMHLVCEAGRVSSAH